MGAPDLLTVTEAAAVLRIGRTTAYELVRSDFRSGGGEGLGVVRVGGQFRIPRLALERLVGGTVSWLADIEPGAGPVEQPGPATTSEPVVPSRSRRRKPFSTSSAPMLPFDE